MISRDSLRKTSSWTHVVLAGGLLALSSWMFYFQFLTDEQKKDISDFAAGRFIASVVYCSFAEIEPPWLANLLYGPDSIETIHEVLESHQKRDDLPERTYLSWALACHRFGDVEKARALIAEREFTEPKELLISNFIRKGELSRSDAKFLHVKVSNSENDWQTDYMLWKLENDATAIENLSGAGNYFYRKACRSEWLFLLIFGSGLILGAVAIFRPSKILPSNCEQPFRIQRLWSVRSVFLVFALGMVISTGLNAVLNEWLYAEQGPPLLGNILVYFVFLGLPASLLVYRFAINWGSALRIFRLRWIDFNPQRLALALITYAVASVILHGLSEVEVWLRMVDATDSITWNELDSPANRFYGLIISVLIAPVFEEIIHRGFVFGALLTRFSVVPAILISSVIFATYHWYSIFGWIFVFVDGTIMCWLYWKSGSLWPGVIFHAILNMVLTFDLHAWYSFG